MGMKKFIQRKIGIKELKARGFSYQQIGERIREFKRLTSVPRFPGLPLDFPLYANPEEVSKKELSMWPKVSLWQRIKTAIAIWWEKLILKLKGGK